MDKLHSLVVDNGLEARIPDVHKPERVERSEFEMELKPIEPPSK